MTGFDAPQPVFTEILALHGKWLGDKPALVTDERTLGWREFDASQNRVANGLIGLGLAPGATGWRWSWRTRSRWPRRCSASCAPAA